MVTEIVKVMSKEKLPQVLTGFGIAGLFGTAVLAVQATPEALQRIEDKKKELKKDKLSVFETVKATWVCYIPAAISGVASAVCIASANNIQAKRTAAMTSAAVMTENAFRDYRETVKETLGKEKEEEIHEEVIRKKAEAEPIDQTEEVLGFDDNDYSDDEDDPRIYIDNVFGREIRCTRGQMRQAEKNLNRRLLGGEGYVTMNDFYAELNLQSVDAGDFIGFDGFRGMYIDIKEGRDYRKKNGRIVTPLIFRMRPVVVPF